MCIRDSINAEYMGMELVKVMKPSFKRYGSYDIDDRLLLPPIRPDLRSPVLKPLIKDFDDSVESDFVEEEPKRKSSKKKRKKKRKKSAESSESSEESSDDE
eukprot:TRINITY_DN11910_c0_g1_i1.p1 TRINITY_DN11910_c0_g1~~TRINITY_DN11910_c0_g1_i1.p1  ORF type:complete len:101 (+),score=32.94 TRINITY_DN11910_c0_g1_i1:60-362(+)